MVPMSIRKNQLDMGAEEQEGECRRKLTDEVFGIRIDICI